MLQKIIERFREILKMNGIYDPISQLCVKISSTETNFCSKVEHVEVIFEDVSKPHLHLFLKSPVESKSYNEILSECELFPKEVQFFKKYLPMAREYCTKVEQLGQTDIYPNCYYGDEKLIVLEDLGVNGYEILDGMHELETAKLALTTLAKHHAISYSIIEEMGGEDAFFQKFPKLRLDAFEKESWRNVLDPSYAMETRICLLENCGLKAGQEAADKLKDLRGKPQIEMMKAIGNTKDNISVVNHGDFWNGNLMFKRDENGKLTDLKLVDLQLTRYSSPCDDISFYLFTNVKAEVLQTNLKEMLHYYLAALNGFSSELKHPIDYTMGQDLSKYFHLGFWMGFCFFNSPVELKAEVKEGQTMAEYFRERQILERKWVEDNPEKCLEIAGRLILYLEMYEMFKGGKL